MQLKKIKRSSYARNEPKTKRIMGRQRQMQLVMLTKPTKSQHLEELDPVNVWDLYLTDDTND